MDVEIQQYHCMFNFPKVFFCEKEKKEKKKKQKEKSY